jgi:hypothetical protein
MKIVCEVCKVEGYLQHIGPNYYRVRHYAGVENGKPKFEYHKQSLQYVQASLSTAEQSPIDPIDPETIDLKLNSSSSVSQNPSGCSLAWLGHQPPTLTTRVQIPATASTFFCGRTWTKKIGGSTVGHCLVNGC